MWLNRRMKMRFIIGLVLFSLSIHGLIYAAKEDNDVVRISATLLLGAWYGVAFLK